MAKTSSVEKHKRNTAKVARFRAYYKDLKKKVRSPKTSDEEREIARRKLAEMPNSARAIRLRSRCQLTGRSRGVYKKFGLSRIKFRELAHQGLLPGVSKASW